MRVFKGYLTIIKRNIGVVIQYLVIFMVITLIINQMIGDMSGDAYSTVKIKVAVIDEDNSPYSEQFIEYLKEEQDVTLMKNDLAKIKEKMFYGDIDYVVTIPKGFEEKCLDNGEKLQVTKEPGKYTAVYLDQQIAQFIGQTKTYKKAGYSTEEAASLVISQASDKTEVRLLDKNGNGGVRPGYIWMTQFLPYFYAAVYCYTLGAVMLHFRKREVKRRIQCAPQSLMQRNLETILAYFVIGIGMWAVSMIMPIAYYGKEFLTAPHLGYILLNSVTMAAAALGMSMAVGMAAKSMNAVNMLANLCSLVLCFLGGVFVDAAIMGESVKKVAVFLPTYWYVKNNGILGDYLTLPKAQVSELIKGYGIQMAFAVACVCVALVISRMKEQEEG